MQPQPLAPRRSPTSLTAGVGVDANRSAEGLQYIAEGGRLLGRPVVAIPPVPRGTVEVRTRDEDRRCFPQLAAELINQRGRRVVKNAHVRRVVPRHSETRSDAGPST